MTDPRKADLEVPGRICRDQQLLDVGRDLGCHHRSPDNGPVFGRLRWRFRNRLIATTAALALAVGQTSPSCAGLGNSVYDTPAANDNSGHTSTTSFVSTAIANLQVYIVGLLGGKLSHVANNAALAALPVSTGRVRRDGFAAASDGGAADYTTTATACTLNNGAGNGGSQIGLTGATYIGCAIIDSTFRTSAKLFDVFGTASDDSASWAAALAYAGSGAIHTLVYDGPTSTIASASRLYVPSNVEILGKNSFEAADGSTNQTGVKFTNASGGWTLGLNVTIKDFHIASTVADHCLEVSGKFDYENVQLSCSNGGSLLTRTITPGSAGTDLNGITEKGLTNGTYTHVPFTGATTGSNTTTATLTVTISGGPITAMSFDQAGTVANGSTFATNLPYFQIGFASGAIYSGSPAIAFAGYGFTANPGRSRARRLYMASRSNTGTSSESLARAASRHLAAI